MVRVLLLPSTCALDESDVAISGKIGEALYGATWQRPLDFQPIDLFSLANSENDPRVVGRKIATSAYLHPASLQIAGLIGQARAYRIWITLFAQ
jgi:hypothetical protein